MKSSSELQVEDWLLKLAIHQPFEITSSAQSVVKGILTYAGTLDMYCPACAKTSTFKGDISTETENISQSEKFAANGFNVSSSFWLHTIFSKQLSCTRVGHVATFYFHIDDGKLFKVGQYPSLANITFGDALKYLPVLGEEKIKEFNQAITLAADGAGLGALVYLKRVLSYLLDMTAQQTKLEQSKYQTVDIATKVLLLEDSLPDSFKHYIEVFSLFNKNDISLTDLECLKATSLITAMIVMLADEKVAGLVRAENAETVQKAFG
ncbi:MAG TPA: hypothetical protein VGJ90_01270 [Methylophilaceae bacterium]|jgi:hypothetical protein